MEGPPLGPGGEDITWPDQVAPRGRRASSTRKIKPQTSNRIVTKELFWQPKHVDASIQKQRSSILTVQSLLLTRDCQYMAGLTAEDDHEIGQLFFQWTSANTRAIYKSQLQGM